MTATGKFLEQVEGKVLRVELLPYHAYGVPNYGRVGLDYQLLGRMPLPRSRLEELRRIVEAHGFEVRIGSQ